MSNNIEDKTKVGCTGCGACVVTCPVNAIEYRLNEEGFFQAFVDYNKCIKCGKCKKVCVKYLEKEKIGQSIKIGELYSAQSKDANTVISCTSGGIAYEIAKYGIANGYKILGTVYDYEKNIAKAIIAETDSEIEGLKGSKYIQSFMFDALDKLCKIAKQDLNAKFIVFGTPCQIAGISNMIEVNKIKNEIIKVDLFCHGVPSYLVWNDYLNEIKNKYLIDKIDNIVFRDKKLGWHNYCLKIGNENKSIFENSENSLFYKAFFDTILYNKHCFNCSMRKELMASDIRLGDFWGKKYMNRDDGVSAIIIGSQKGKELIEKINEIKITKLLDINDCLENQSTHDYDFIEIRNKYIKQFKQYGLKRIIKKYRRKLPLKLRIKNIIKSFISIFPLKFRLLAKKTYHRIIYK